MINHLQAMVKTVQNRQSTEWIDKLKEYVLDAQNFSDKEEKIELSCELVNLLEDVKDKGIVSLKPFESKVYTLSR